MGLIAFHDRALGEIAVGAGRLLAAGTLAGLGWGRWCERLIDRRARLILCAQLATTICTASHAATGSESLRLPAAPLQEAIHAVLRLPGAPVSIVELARVKNYCPRSAAGSASALDSISFYTGSVLGAADAWVV